MSETNETQEEPAELSSSPVLLWRDDSRRGRIVIAACHRCRKIGIKLHQPLHEATDLLLRESRNHAKVSHHEIGTPNIFRHDPVADDAAIQRVASLLQQTVSPLVAIEPVPAFAGLASAQAQTLLLDVTGIGDWFGDEGDVLTEAHRVLAQLGLHVRLAIADTSAAAWAIVRFSSRLSLSLSADIPSPTEGGVDSQGEIVPPGKALAVTGRLPVRALRLDDPTAHQLDRLGLRCIADVLALPRHGLASRLGSDLLRRIDELSGTVPQTLVMHHPVVEDVAICELEYPTSDRAILEHRLQILVEQVSARLTARRRGALRLACQFAMTGHTTETFEIGLFMPTADTKHLMRLISNAIDQRQLPGSVERVTLSVTLGGLLQQYQPTLFDDDSISQVATRQSLARMIETLAGRLGRNAVVGIESNHNPLPEKAFKPRPLAGETRSTLLLGRPQPPRRSSRHSNQQSDPKRPGRFPSDDQRDAIPHEASIKSPRQSILPSAVGPTSNDPLRRPLRLLATPEAIEVIELAPNGSPSRIRMAGRVHIVARTWGPERIETGWWDGPQIRRDYYRIELEAGPWWWVFHEVGRPLPTSWKLHGHFI